MKKKTKLQCPKCKSKKVIPIAYGLPTYETFKLSEEGKIKLGGCCVTNNDPEYFCKDCGNKF